MIEEKQTERFEGWALLEIMGHRRLGGYVRDVAMFGASMCRIDVPAADGNGDVATQYYGASAVYCMTPCTEETARAVAREAQPAPVTAWDARRLLPPTPGGDGSPLLHICDMEDCDQLVAEAGGICAECRENF